jgi:hypothetical protein
MGNLPNHLKDFKEGIRIRILFFKDQCGPYVWYVGKGDRRRKSRRFIRNFWGVEKIYLECGKEESKKKYVLCV